MLFKLNVSRQELVLDHYNIHLYKHYLQTSDISRTLVGNKFADHLDASSYINLGLNGRRCSNYICILNGFGKDNYKTWRNI